MSKYTIYDTQTTPDGKETFVVKYAAGGNVPPLYEFDSLGGAQSRQEELEKADRVLTEQNHGVINRAIEARTEWLASPDDETGKKLLGTFLCRYNAIADQSYRDHPDRKHVLLRWQQSLVDGLPPDHQEQFLEFKQSKGLGR